MRKHLLLQNFSHILKKTTLFYDKLIMTRQATVYKIVSCDELDFPFSTPSFDKKFLSDQWKSSRGALFLALQEIGHNVDKSEDLNIIDYLYLEHFKEIKVSLSHHNDFGAALICTDPSVLSVGIDIEANDRVVKEGTLKYFNHDNDDFDTPYLKKWVGKEATFKALFPFWKREKPLVLSDIWIVEDNFGVEALPLGKIEWFSQQNFIGANAFLYEELK